MIPFFTATLIAATASLQCGDVKAVYKSTECCGDASKAISTGLSSVGFTHNYAVRVKNATLVQALLPAFLASLPLAPFNAFYGNVFVKQEAYNGCTDLCPPTTFMYESVMAKPSIMAAFSIFLGSMTEAVPIENNATWMRSILEKYTAETAPVLGFVPFFDAVEHTQEDWVFENSEDAALCRDPTSFCGRFIGVMRQLNAFKTPSTQVKWNVWGKSPTYASSTFAHWVV